MPVRICASLLYGHEFASEPFRGELDGVAHLVVVPFFNCFWASPVVGVPSFDSVITACVQLADSFYKLHKKDLCYRDISFGNFFFHFSKTLFLESKQLSRHEPFT